MNTQSDPRGPASRLRQPLFWVVGVLALSSLVAGLYLYLRDSGDEDVHGRRGQRPESTSKPPKAGNTSAQPSGDPPFTGAQPVSQETLNRLYKLLAPFDRLGSGCLTRDEITEKYWAQLDKFIATEPEAIDAMVWTILNSDFKFTARTALIWSLARHQDVETGHRALRDLHRYLTAHLPAGENWLAENILCAFDEGARTPIDTVLYLCSVARSDPKDEAGALSVLGRILSSENGPHPWRTEIVSALESEFHRHVQDGNQDGAASALDALAIAGDDRMAEQAVTLATAPQAKMRAAALTYLGQQGKIAAEEIIFKALRTDPDRDVRIAALNTFKPAASPAAERDPSLRRVHNLSAPQVEALSQVLRLETDESVVHEAFGVIHACYGPGRPPEAVIGILKELAQNGPADPRSEQAKYLLGYAFADYRWVPGQQ